MFKKTAPTSAGHSFIFRGYTYDDYADASQPVLVGGEGRDEFIDRGQFAQFQQSTLDVVGDGLRLRAGYGFGACAGNRAARSAGHSSPGCARRSDHHRFVHQRNAGRLVHAGRSRDVRGAGGPGRPSNVDLVKNMSETGANVGEANRVNFYPIGAATVNLRSLGSE